ncbi:HNH endonuclease [Sphingomonas sp. LaA6.9]|uniref:HNH endonuclease n=1 Tax=Sphingomonas sp. LaA6.9 TaxID=2919914 RepID=UPI001F4F60B5|nr:HNH endonuclease [Sphingomonas sp. LaA6.9]MCJ8159385.1 HNH endonuclease [Sphingomonas sp. LaA6.9]
MSALDSPCCWLCERPLGHRVEWHHPVPRSRGGSETVPLHPICHRTIHAIFSNVELARRPATPAALRENPAMARFLVWIATKPADFHAPTRTRR